jgi:sugar phosphate isomerase/epimerase
MKLSLSVRIAEAFDSKERTTIPFPELAQLAADVGYQAVCMRASVAGVHTPREEIAAMRRTLDALGLAVSMVTADFAIPLNNERGPDALRNVTPHLDVAEAFGAPLVRVCMKAEEDLPWAQRAADEARERGLKLAHQSHTRSLFETVDGTLDVLRRVGRENFGLIYEPANLLLCGQDYGPATLRAFAPWLFNVYLQNHRLNPDGEAVLETWTRGPVRFDHLPLWEPGGVDFAAVFAGLAAVGYDGYVTVHQAFAGQMEPEEAARRSYEYLQAKIRDEG